MADPVYQADIEQPDKPIPQLNSETFASQIFWLALVFALLYWLLARTVIPKIRDVLVNRENQIQHDLSEAEKARHEAEATQVAYEGHAANAREAASLQLQEAQREIDAMIAAEHDKLNQTLTQSLAKSEAQIAEKRDAATKELQPVVESLTADIAQRFLDKKPTKAAITKALKQSTEGVK